MLSLRRANINDHEFLARIDLKTDGYTTSDIMKMTEHQKEEHSKKIRNFLTDQDKGAFVYEDPDSNTVIGEIMYTLANRDVVYPWKTIFHEIDRTMFQSDGRFMEIFSLWIHPEYRRSGLATQLKLKLEEEAQNHKVNLIYTHTEVKNNHVIELNKKLGYQEVRRGPIWDEIIRVSLIKQLTLFN
jgi:ribosomal protein S18 acetylase RimI-like enzyme